MIEDFVIQDFHRQGVAESINQIFNPLFGDLQ